ncbi:MAG: orotidine-5'-phosphate decarboxylase [Cyclobacteriaceae bacterium]
MTRLQLYDKIKDKESFLCVGLDTDISKIPKHLLQEADPIFAFNKQIIDATHQYAVAYKPNIAFYESQGAKGWESLEKTVAYIPKDIFTIADAKRADIGNTSSMYAKAFFERMNFDSITVSPYMGKDSVQPFLEFDRKWVIILAATSNSGSLDFQHLLVEDGSESLHERVIRKSKEWGNRNNTMYVVGATRVESLVNIRRLIPDHFLLIPGVGAQGGDLASVCKFGMNKQCGLLVNSSRSILYADSSKDFAEVAGREAKKLQVEMAHHLQNI